MLRDQAVSYHFQPIFSARNGRAIAYEALMRPEMPTLRSPLTVMKLARELNRLYDIEHITLFKASSAFEKNAASSGRTACSLSTPLPVSA